MIAGEFAVLIPNQRIIVMAVNRFVYTTIRQDVAVNTLTLENFKLRNLKWDYDDDIVHVHSRDRRKVYVENAMTTAFNYLKENAVPIRPFHLSVYSELDDASGVKYGLGSSAAVVTSVITAILKAFLPTEPPAPVIFKLASITHVKTQGNGSGADVAASTYGGVLAYTSFQSEWLKEAIEAAHTLTELVSKEWKYWSVAHIRLPETLHMSIGWTGKPASTSQLVKQILELRQSDPESFKAFLEKSDRAVKSFLHGAETGDIETLLHGVKENGRALAEVGEAAQTDVVTPLLSVLCDLAEEHGGAGKSSGAGGGDCGIAFLASHDKTEKLEQAWTQNGIKPLALTMSPVGSVES